MILFAGVTKRGDDMSARRWLKGVSSEKLNSRLKRTWNCGAAIFNLNICHGASLEFICLFCAFHFLLFFLFLFYFPIPRYEAFKPESKVAVVLNIFVSNK